MGFDYSKFHKGESLTINGKNLSNYDPTEVKNAIKSLPENERELLKALFTNHLHETLEERGVILDDNYAKHAGRPSLTKVPFGRCTNDGMPYIPGHAPNCDGKLDYNENIYTKRKICWCMWSSKSVRHDKKKLDKGERILWKMYDDRTGPWKGDNKR